MSFMNALENEMNISVTENGTVGFNSSGKALLDLNFAVSSLRNASESEVANKFIKAFAEDKVLAMKWLFFARDARQGLGERRLFRVVISNLVESNPEMVLPLIKLIPEYGRVDDMWCLLDNKDAAEVIYKLVDNQFAEDLRNMKAGKSISLFGKWAPSCNSSSKQTKKYANQLRKALGLTEREYRKALSAFRKYLDVTEVKMSANNWSDIDYEKVPSRANLLYGNAFMKHDEERRRDYLSKLERGEVKINSSVLYPHDIVHKYMKQEVWHPMVQPKDAALEGLWSSLPDIVNGCNNTIVVADGSGSMTVPVGNTKVTALEVANSLAIYFAERASGEFKDKYITFSENPQLVDFSNCDSLHDKIQTALAHNEVANTNIEAVFDLILQTAIDNNMSQDDMPKNVLILSDMEFDSCAICGEYTGRWSSVNRPTKRLFDEIADRYKTANLLIPRLVFWNINSRTNTIPVKENDLGVALVSGFSPNICKMVMSEELDPYKCLLETLNSKRYDAIEEVLNN